MQNWPESSALRIELFSLEMQAVYGSYYRNKVKVPELLAKLVPTEASRLAFVEAWKHKFRKSQREALAEYVAAVDKVRDFLLQLTGGKQKLLSRKASQSSQRSSERDDTPKCDKIISFTVSKPEQRPTRFSHASPQSKPYLSPVQPRPVVESPRYVDEGPEKPIELDTRRISKYSIQHVVQSPQKVIYSPTTQIFEYEPKNLEYENLRQFNTQNS